MAVETSSVLVWILSGIVIESPESIVHANYLADCSTLYKKFEKFERSNTLTPESTKLAVDGRAGISVRLRLSSDRSHIFHSAA